MQIEDAKIKSPTKCEAVKNTKTMPEVISDIFFINQESFYFKKPKSK